MQQVGIDRTTFATAKPLSADSQNVGIAIAEFKFIADCLFFDAFNRLGRLHGKLIRIA